MEQAMLFPEIDYGATKDALERVLLNVKLFMRTHKHDPRVQRIEQALDSLNATERLIIEQYYFKDEKDYIIYGQLNVESTKYYEIKKMAICIMAGALRVEVYKTLDHND